jgi:hypothetical protein
MAQKATIHDAIQGAWIEFGTFSLNPASIDAAAQGVEEVTIEGAKVGDMVFVSPEALENRVAPVGAKVTATDTVSVYLNNLYDATTAVDGGAKTWSYMLIHLS